MITEAAAVREAALLVTKQAKGCNLPIAWYGAATAGMPGQQTMWEGSL
ncbi:MAG: hypothetical protein J2P54_10670 [Bradyrhizobiaceae bacterium]|nr:hypothetical protein [Bradyrhizobiaceae bacterium]